MIEAARVGVGPGDGTLCRRSGGVLFVVPDDGRTDADPDLSAIFMGAPDDESARDRVLLAVADADFRAPAFVLVTWRPSLSVHVFGDVAVDSDLPTMPRLSGAAATTWVEHRVLRPPSTCAVWIDLAGSVQDRSDLTLGVVPAGSVRVELHDVPHAVDPPLEPPPVTTTVPTTGGRVPATADPDPIPHPADPPPPQSPAPDPAPTEAPGAPTTAWDALARAGGDDWMEESLDLGPRVSSPPSPSLGSDAADGRRAGEARSAWPDPNGPDPFADAEQTMDPSDIRPAEHVAVPTVPARPCRRGHPNAPLAAVCRVCGDLLDPSMPLQHIPTPVLARLRLPDGRTVDVDRPVVLGRRPDAGAARVDAFAVIATVSDDPTVSRTHLVVRPDGWDVVAIDCGSAARSARVDAGGTASELPPWSPVIVRAGDRLFLGGPVEIVVQPGVG